MYCCFTPLLKKKPRDLNFERRHAMFATPHVKATLCFFVPKQSNFFCVFYIELQKVKVPRQKIYYFFLFYIITCVQFWSKNHFFSFLLKIHLPFPHNNVIQTWQLVSNIVLASLQVKPGFWYIKFPKKDIQCLSYLMKVHYIMYYYRFKHFTVKYIIHIIQSMYNTALDKIVSK